MAAEKYIDEFVEQARRMGRERLMPCSSGNISWRIADGQALVSGTGSWLSRLDREHVALCDIRTGARLDGPKPSMESSFHLNILRRREDVDVVLHFQSEYATIVSCMKDKPVDFNVTAEVPCYCGTEIPILPYFRPGSPELAAAVSDALADHDTVMLSKHGQVVCGATFDDVFQKAVFFEMACGIIVRAGRGNYLTLTPEEIRDLEIYVLGKTAE